MRAIFNTVLLVEWCQMDRTGMKETLSKAFDELCSSVMPLSHKKDYSKNTSFSHYFGFMQS